MKTGEICPQNGIYKCTTHPANTIPLAKGNRFPPCPYDKGHSAIWVLVRPA